MQSSTTLPAQAGKIRNAMTIDVEDYFQVSAFAPHIARDQWDSMDCRVERNVQRILGLLAERDVKATFFTLGWIAERYPQVVRAIVAGGHELASHGYGHLRASDPDRAAFDPDIRSSKAMLEDIGGVPVIGYRAPSFSIGRRNLWMHELLARTGHHYSSSIYPIHHDHYGMPDAPRFAYRTPCGLTEIPAATVKLGSTHFPASGGGYFRLLPYAVSAWNLRRINLHDGERAVFFCHPWEIDPEQPKVSCGRKTRFRHYLNLSRTEQRIVRLLEEFKWDRIDRVFADAIVERPQ